jgi:O-antigen ligase
VSSNAYLNALFSRDIIENNSLMGRFETWRYLWEMIKEKPIFGYAPYKEYFYTNNIYPESEYILQTWRYGFIGLLLYLSLLVTPFLSGLKNKLKKHSIPIILATVLIAINSLANNPFSERAIMVLYAMTIGIYFNTILKPTES